MQIKPKSWCFLIQGPNFQTCLQLSLLREFVSTYKYLGILVDSFLSFTAQIQQLVKKTKTETSFFSFV